MKFILVKALTIVMSILALGAISKSETRQGEKKEVIQEFRNSIKTCEDQFQTCLDNDEIPDNQCVDAAISCHDIALQGKSAGISQIRACVQEKKQSLRAVNSVRPADLCSSMKGADLKNCKKQVRQEKKAKRQQIRNEFSACLDRIT